MKKVLTLTALSTLLLSTSAMAAVFHLREQSAAAQGNAYAGATAGAENGSYAYYNVAGITRQKGMQVNLGGTYIAPRATAKNVRGQSGERGADVENVVHAAVSPNGTVSYQLNDKAFAAIAANSQFGMITKYDPQWVGSDHGITSDLKSGTITPMFAYKATDKLSLGAGVQMQYVWAHLTSSNTLPMGGTVVKVGNVTTNGNDFDMGYQLGALYEFTDSTRVGVGYRSEINHKLKGKMTSSGRSIPLFGARTNQKISAKLTTPAMLSMGVYHDVNEKWAVMAEYQRVFWSSFQNLTFKSQSGGYTISNVKENWRDTNFYSIGTSYMLDNQWKLRLGLAYDQSAVRYAHRTPRIPDSDRIWYSAGLGYQYNENLSFDIGYTYIQAHKAKMNTAVTQNLGYNASADYSNSVKVFAFSLNYAF
mgnify:CR=1 FL=1